MAFGSILLKQNKNVMIKGPERLLTYRSHNIYLKVPQYVNYNHAKVKLNTKYSCFQFEYNCSKYFILIYSDYLKIFYTVVTSIVALVVVNKKWSGSLYLNVNRYQINVRYAV